MSKKQYIYFLVIILVLICFWFLFIRDDQKQIRNFPSKGTDIIAFGDSLIVGAGATEGNDFVSLLSKKIGLNIVNLGVSGNTTEDGLSRINEIDQYNPKIVLLLLGGNDAIRKIPIETTFRNLEIMISKIQSKGAIVLLLGVKGGLLGDKFKPEFERISKKYYTAYVPNVLDDLFGDRRFMEDTVHPNNEGNRIIAEKVYPVLLPLLK